MTDSHNLNGSTITDKSVVFLSVTDDVIIDKINDKIKVR